MFQSAPPAEDSGSPGTEQPPPPGSLWCPLGPLGTLSADLGARLTGGLAKLDWTALGRPKMPLKGVRAQLGWCRCLKVSVDGFWDGWLAMSGHGQVCGCPGVLDGWTGWPGVADQSCQRCGG